MEQLKQVQAILRKQLAEIDEQIEKLNTSEQPKALTMNEIKETVAKFNKSKKWKSFVNADYGVVDNIVELLGDCYYPFLDAIKTNYVKTAKVDLGKRGSIEWQNFMIRVIKKVLEPETFTTQEQYDDFSDTANGCDEIVWNHGLEVIDEMVYEN
jgi:hypothetical protein